ncbi:MAG: DUF2282 domain-containing protein [Alphaproteobacteria bacterium]|nr:DUF2282 domain-containing protein [Alphaproteobacteria bacterium]
MKTTKILSAAALAAVVALSLAPAAQAASSQEKCYGVVKAGHNDCKTAAHACAGHAKTDGGGEFVLVPAGLCDKLAGGSTTPPGEMMKGGMMKDDMKMDK